MIQFESCFYLKHTLIHDLTAENELGYLVLHATARMIWENSNYKVKLDFSIRLQNAIFFPKIGTLAGFLY